MGPAVVVEVEVRSPGKGGRIVAFEGVVVAPRRRVNPQAMKTVATDLVL
ncbi:hypothetical protein K8R78_05310 [bacterium]|nr:hypothetical protein [bacterium]